MPCVYMARLALACEPIWSASCTLCRLQGQKDYGRSISASSGSVNTL